MLLKRHCWPGKSVFQPFKQQAALVKESALLGEGCDIWKTTLQQIWSCQTSLPPPHPLSRAHPFASPRWMDGPTPGGRTDPHMQKQKRIIKVLKSLNEYEHFRAQFTARHGTAQAGSILP